MRSPLSSPEDPHASLLIEEPAAASIREPPTDATSLRLCASPNPFSPGVRVSYPLGRSLPVRLAVYDVESRLVRVLTDGLKTAENHTSSWDGLDAHGHCAGSGIYFLRLEAGNQAVTRKALFLR